MKKRKRILIVIPNLLMGGAERLTVYLLKYIDRKKFVLALCLFEKTETFFKDIPTDVEFFYLNKKNRWSFFCMLKRLNEVIAIYKPDIVYTRMWYATAVAVFSRMLFLKRYPIIANEEHSHLRDISNVDKYGFLKKKMTSFVYKKANIVLVPSEGVKKEITKHYRLNPEKVKLIYNSVDLKTISNCVESKKLIFKQKSDNESKTIVAFGRIIKRKGFDDLLKAFSNVRKEMKTQLIIIGDGEELLNLQNLARELCLKDVVFTGFIENPYVILSEADVFVFSSHWEGFGNVIIEAMACGVPVISTCCPFGPEEIITNGENGLLVPVGDVDFMTKTILKLLKDDQLRKQLAEAGKNRAKDFSVEKMVSEYERVFDEI